MDDHERHRKRLESTERLALKDASLPTSPFGRLRRLATSAYRANRLLRRARTGDGLRDKDIAAIGKIVSSFGELKGVAMKAGQLLSYVDVTMPDEARAALSALQTHAQPMPFAEVQEIVRRALGARGPQLLEHMNPTPIAAASVGQVHHARLPNGTEVAVKVQYPGIEKAIASDFGPAAFGSRVAALIYPGAKIDSFISEARSRFLEECDYRQEALRQQEFAKNFADHETIMVPAVHSEYSSRRVLTTTFVEGVHLNEFLAGEPEQALRDKLGRALFEFYIGSLFKYRLYNCDPHPGNFLFCPDGRLAVLDYGCTRLFENDFVRRLAALTRAVQSDRRTDLHQALLGLKIVGPMQDYDYETARTFMRAFYGSMLRDEPLVFERGRPMSFRDVTMNKKQLLQLALPGEFLFLMRIRFGLTSVLASLGARANWYALEKAQVVDVPPPPPITTQQGVVGPSSYDVILTHTGDNPIQLIRELRECLDVGIREAKDLAERAPTTIAQAIDYETAERLRQRLQSAGATTKLKGSGSRPEPPEFI